MGATAAIASAILPASASTTRTATGWPLRAAAKIDLTVNGGRIPSARADRITPLAPAASSSAPRRRL